MLDGIKIALHSEGIKVLCTESKEFTSVSDLTAPEFVEHPITGGTLTLEKNNADDKLSIKGNPTSWLTGQNVVGSNNAFWLTLRCLKKLEQLGRVSFTREAKKRILNGDFFIHQASYNMYLDFSSVSKLQSLDLLKTIIGGLSTTAKTLYDPQFLLFTGPGLLLKYKTKSLTLYDKLRQREHKQKPANLSYFKEGLSWLEPLMRCEVLFRHNHFSRQNRLMSWWKDKDWDKLVEDMIIKEIEFNKLDYLMCCPNVFAHDYLDTWRNKDKKLFAKWLDGDPLSRVDHRRLYHRYKFDSDISVIGHRNTLWSLLRPDDFTKAISVDLTTATEFPGHKIFKTITPLKDHLVVGAPSKTLRLIDKACIQN